jgi:hypothetical protein
MNVPEKYVELALDTLAELCELGDVDQRRTAASLMLDFALAEKEKSEDAAEPAVEEGEETEG